MGYYLGVDIGTFESKGVLVEADGSVAASASRPHRMIVPQPGWAEHRANEDWWGDFRDITRQILAESGVEPGAVRGVACSAIGPCMLPVDDHGEPLCNAVLYGVDTRAASEIDELTKRHGEGLLLDRGGNALTSQSVGPKILWLRRNRPDIFARTAKVLTSTSFLVHKLTGRYVIDHHTAAGFSPLYNVERQAWDPDFGDGIIESGRLPDLAWTTEIAGEVSTWAAAETGLAEGTPVTVGTIDAAAEAISVGVTASSDMMIMYGSTIFIIMITGERVRDPRLWYAPWLFPGSHACMSGLATSGTLSHWFRDHFARDLPIADAFATLAEEAQSSPPGARGLIVQPYFSGERTPLHDPQAKGSIFGLNLTHGRSDIYRAIFEGIAYATGHVIDTYREAGQEPKRIASVGGGIKNRIWLQATSDVARRAQLLRRHSMGASLGNGFLAALAIGDIAAGDIERWNPVTGEVLPDTATEAVYARQFAVFKELYASTRGLMAQLS